MSFFTGTKGKYKQLSQLGPEQQGLWDQLQAAARGQGAGGAFGSAADYYRSLLDDNNSTFDAMAAPETRRFNEEIIPGLSEQFAGMGFGGSGLSGSGFRNAAVNAGTDLAERLGAIRANLRQQGAAGLTGIGQAGLQQTHENIYEPRQPGLFDQLGEAFGSAAGAFGGGIGKGVGNWISGKYRNKAGRGTQTAFQNSGNNGPGY
jgi:hypothetical protein